MFNPFGGSKNQVRRSGTRQQRPSTSAASSSGLSSNSLSRKHRPDYSLLIIALLLSVAGLIVVYAISPGLAATRGVDNNYFIIKQIIAIGLGLAVFAVASVMPVNVLKNIVMF